MSKIRFGKKKAIALCFSCLAVFIACNKESPVAPVTYQLMVTAGTGGTITAPASQTVTVNKGAATTIAASSGTGYSFVNWTVTSGTASIANPASASTTVTLTAGNATVQANFAVITYQLTVNAGTGGTITTPPASPATVAQDAATIITAAPNAGYAFVNWTVTNGTASIADATVASTTVTLNSGNATVQANFAIKQYSITITSVNGTVAKNPDQSLYDSNTTVTLTATTDIGYWFTGWSGDLSGSANPAAVRMNGNKNITATFSNTCQLTVSAAAGGMITAPSSSPITVALGAATTITAAPNAGYVFSEWTDTSGNASIAYKNSAYTTVKLVSGNAVLQAGFIPIVSALTPIDISAFEKESGANFSYFSGTWTALPDFSALTPDSSGPCDTLDVAAVPHQANNFGVVFTAYLSIPMEWDYTFYLRSSGGSQLLINDSVIIDNDSLHTSPVEDSATVRLSDYPAPTYQIEVRYFDTSSSPSLWVGYACPDIGIDKQTIPNGALSRPNTAPVPKIIVTSPAGGEAYHLGDTIHVRWTYKNPRGQVFASLSVDSGITFNNISAYAFPSDTNWYNWRIPLDADTLITQSAFIEVDEYPPYMLYAVSNRFSIAARRK